MEETEKDKKEMEQVNFTKGGKARDGLGREVQENGKGDGKEASLLNGLLQTFLTPIFKPLIS